MNAASHDDVVRDRAAFAHYPVAMGDLRLVELSAATIVAVNKDPEAPIFELVDFGVVGDLHAVLPAATEKVKERKG